MKVCASQSPEDDCSALLAHREEDGRTPRGSTLRQEGQWLRTGRAQRRHEATGGRGTGADHAGVAFNGWAGRVSHCFATTPAIIVPRMEVTAPPPPPVSAAVAARTRCSTTHTKQPSNYPETPRCSTHSPRSFPIHAHEACGSKNLSQRTSVPPLVCVVGRRPWNGGLAADHAPRRPAAASSYVVCSTALSHRPTQHTRPCLSPHTEAVP